MFEASINLIELQDIDEHYVIRNIKISLWQSNDQMISDWIDFLQEWPMNRDKI